MTISPLALAAKKVIDAAWLHGEPYDLASQAAFALESARLLQSPETAAELAEARAHGEYLMRDVLRLRARVAELEAERHSTNETLDDAAKALQVQRDRVAALAERLRAGQEWQRGRIPELVSENLVSQSELREIFGIPLVAPWGDGISRRIAPTQALCEDGPVEAGDGS